MALGSKRARQILAAVLLLVGTGLAACSGESGPATAARAQQPMPTFELETLDGTRFSSRALSGKVALVDFWATWCQPCIEEIPHWNELQQRYANRGFTVLGITVRSGWPSDIKSDIEKFDFEIEYPVLMGNEELAEAFGGVLGFPTAFLITRDGRIYKKYTGQHPGRQAEIEADIQKLLSQNL